MHTNSCPQHSIRFPEGVLTESSGRNGPIQTTGVYLSPLRDELHLGPITSQGYFARMFVGLPAWRPVLEEFLHALSSRKAERVAFPAGLTAPSLGRNGFVEGFGLAVGRENNSMSVRPITSRGKPSAATVLRWPNAEDVIAPLSEAMRAWV